MKLFNSIMQGFCIALIMFCVSCQGMGSRGSRMVGAFGGTKNITQVRRIVIFPFPKSKSTSDLFYRFASTELWKNRVVTDKNILKEFARLGLDPQTTYLSKEQAISIAGKVRADAFLIGYNDEENVLHLKIVNLNTQHVWIKKRELLASSSIRMLVEELKADFRDVKNINFEKPIEDLAQPLPLNLAILPADNETTNFNAGEAFRKIVEMRFKEANYSIVPTSIVDSVLKTTFSITDGGQLATVPPREIAEKLGVEGLVYIVVHDFDYQTAVVYQKRKVSATLIIKGKDGKILWSKDVVNATGNMSLNSTEIAQDILSSLAKQLFETATGTQLVLETYAATKDMLKRPWWEKYGGIWNF